jgi:hypothetical protein
MCGERVAPGAPRTRRVGRAPAPGRGCRTDTNRGGRWNVRGSPPSGPVLLLPGPTFTMQRDRRAARAARRPWRWPSRRPGRPGIGPADRGRAAGRTRPGVVADGGRRTPAQAAAASCHGRDRHRRGARRPCAERGERGPHGVCRGRAAPAGRHGGRTPPARRFPDGDPRSGGPALHGPDDHRPDVHRHAALRRPRSDPRLSVAGLSARPRPHVRAEHLGPPSGPRSPHGGGPLASPAVHPQPCRSAAAGR